MTEEMKSLEKSYGLLKHAIVVQAEDDYLKALTGLEAIKQDLVKYTEEDEMQLNYVKTDCEIFFNSNWGKECGVVNPVKIMEKCRMQVNGELMKIVQRYNKRKRKQYVNVPKMGKNKR